MRIGIAAGVFLAGAVCQADIVSLTPLRDNTLYETAPGVNTSNALGPNMFSGRTSGFGRRRAILYFDLSSIPAGSDITDVSLSLNVNRGDAGGSLAFLYRLTSDWGQGTSRASEPGGDGASATPGDPTWFYSAFNSAAWQSPGGDFEPFSISAIPIAGPGVYTWESDQGLRTDVQMWIGTPANNFGWLLIGDEGNLGSALRISSRESALPPILTVTFTPPSPCGTSDFDGDGDSGTDADIEAFFACLSGVCCPTCFPGGSDFNGDGDSGTDADIEAFFRVLAGDTC